MGDVLGELHKAREVFIEKATEQARHMAWVIAVIYSKVKYLLAIGFSTRYGRLKNSNLALCLKTKHSVDKYTFSHFPSLYLTRQMNPRILKLCNKVSEENVNFPSWCVTRQLFYSL